MYHPHAMSPRYHPRAPCRLLITPTRHVTYSSPLPGKFVTDGQLLSEAVREAPERVTMHLLIVRPAPTPNP